MTESLTRYASITIDRQGALLALFLVVVALSSVSLVPWLQAPEQPSPDGSSTEQQPRVQQSRELASRSPSEQAAAGGGWAITQALLAGVILLTILLWNRLPALARELISRNAIIVLLLYVGAETARSSWSVPYLIGAVVAGYTLLRVADAYDVYWAVNDFLAVGIAIVGGAVAGVALGIPFIALGLVGLSLYDHVFANRRTWMFTLGNAIVRLRLPVLIVVPSRWRFAWSELRDLGGGSDDADESPLLFGIGTADLLLPAMFAAAVMAHSGATEVVGLPLPVWGLLGGLALAGFRLRWELLNRGAGAGLPAIATGVLGGWGLVAATLFLVGA